MQRFADAVLSSGEVAILSGAGKSGKSYIALALAVAAAQGGGEGARIRGSLRPAGCGAASNNFEL